MRQIKVQKLLDHFEADFNEAIRDAIAARNARVTQSEVTRVFQRAVVRHRPSESKPAALDDVPYWLELALLDTVRTFTSVPRDGATLALKDRLSPWFSGWVPVPDGVVR